MVLLLLINLYLFWIIFEFFSLSISSLFIWLYLIFISNMIFILLIVVFFNHFLDFFSFQFCLSTFYFIYFLFNFGHHSFNCFFILLLFCFFNSIPQYFISFIFYPILVIILLIALFFYSFLFLFYFSILSIIIFFH